MRRAEEWVRLVREESSDAWRDIIEQVQREVIEEAAQLAYDHWGHRARYDAGKPSKSPWNDASVRISENIRALLPHREEQL